MNGQALFHHSLLFASGKGATLDDFELAGKDCDKKFLIWISFCMFYLASL